VTCFKICLSIYTKPSPDKEKVVYAFQENGADGGTRTRMSLAQQIFLPATAFAAPYLAGSR